MDGSDEKGDEFPEYIEDEEEEDEQHEQQDVNEDEYIEDQTHDKPIYDNPFDESPIYDESTIEYGPEQYEFGRRSMKRSPKTRKTRSSKTRKTRRRSSKTRSKKTKRSNKSNKSNKCKALLQEKIRINMNELKNGLFKSHSQALAVSYAQVRKMYPICKF